MVDRLDRSMGSMGNRSNSERLRGFCDGWTDRQTDICNSRVAFATEKETLFSTLNNIYLHLIYNELVQQYTHISLVQQKM